MGDKILPFVKKGDKYREEMVDMLLKTVESVKSGDITGFVFVARKKTADSNRDAFEYIVANALDIGLIGEIHVINNRLAAMYDAYTDSLADERETDGDE